MSSTEVVGDLLALEELAAQEKNVDRRRALDAVRSHVADRDRGAKVSEAAQVLVVSQPTVRAWIEAGILITRSEASPVRVDLLSLVAVKRVVDLLRGQGHDRKLLVAAMGMLRDRAALEGEGVAEGLQDLADGRLVPVTEDFLDRLAAPSRGKKRSTSS